MFRAIGNAIMWVITIPVRMYRAFVNGVIALQNFLDRRRNHICAAILASMMAVVGIEMRHSGYADARPGEYTAEVVPRQPGDVRPRKSFGDAIMSSLRSLKSKIPSFTSTAAPAAASSGFEPIEPAKPTIPELPIAKPEPQIPVITASQQRSIMPPAPPMARELPKLPQKPAVQKLIIPEPTVIDLSELDEPEPELPDIATLVGQIEFEDDEPDTESDSVFDR